MAGERSPGVVSEREMFVAPPDDAPARPLPAMPLDISADPSIRLPWRVAGFLRSLPLFSRPRLARALATEADRGVGFLFVPVFLALGVVVYFSLAREPGAAALGACLLALIAIAFLTRGRPATRMAVLAALLILLGMALAKIETLKASTKVIGGEISTRLTGAVAQVEHMASGRVRLTIDVVATERPVLRYAPDRVRVSARSIPDDILPGATVTGIVRLMPPSGPVRPESYDFSFNSYFDGIGASGFFMKGPERAVEIGPASLSERFRASVERARNAVAGRIRDRIGDAEGEIAAALVAGVRAGIPEDVNEALRRAGLYHIISISGLHMALVAGTIMGLLRGGFALFPEFASRRPVKKYAASVAIAGLAAYLFFSGADVAAQRSFIMLAVMLTALLFDRAALTMRNLAISAVVVIALSPHEVIGPSFQMSFAATAALVGAYAAWSDWRSARPLPPPPGRSLASSALRKLIIIALGLAATSLIAGGATSIYSAYHFQQISSLGLLANLSAMPIVSTAVMPFAVLGVLAMPFGMDGPFFDVMGAGLTLTIAIARWFAERSPLDAVGLISPRAVIVLSVALLIATICTTWLRATALPFALAGMLLLPHQPSPDLLISEDARLLGLATGDGNMAVNRTRPNEFTTDNWLRALEAQTLLKPEMRKIIEERPKENAPALILDGKPVEKVIRPATGTSDGHATNAPDALKSPGSSFPVMEEPERGPPTPRPSNVLPLSEAHEGLGPEAVDHGLRAEAGDGDFLAAQTLLAEAKEATGAWSGVDPEAVGHDGSQATPIAAPDTRTDSGETTIGDGFPATVTDASVRKILDSPIPARHQGPAGAAFICEDGLCLARHPSGAIVAHAADAVAAARACDQASIIVIDDATAGNVCAGVLIVTKRDLARRGGASVRFTPVTRSAETSGSSNPNPGTTRVKAEISYAIGRRPYRPWHDHRRFSREARGMPPYQRKPRAAASIYSG